MWEDAILIPERLCITDGRDGLAPLEVQPQAVKYLRTGGHGFVEN